MTSLAAKTISKLRKLPNAIAYQVWLTFIEVSVQIGNAQAKVSRPASLIVLDDYYPSLVYAYRTAEFNTYLERFPAAQIQTILVYDPTKFSHELKQFTQRFPQFHNRIRFFRERAKLHAEGAYLLFIHNAYRFIEYIEANRVPFAFTLYPTSTFGLDNEESDAKIRRVLSSPMFRKVIVTQPITRDYLLRKGFCTEDQIEYVFGVVMPPDRLKMEPLPRRRYGIDKPELDICFVAHKYMPGGIDKGYDRFLAAARMLRSHYPKTRFHVVGPYGPEDGDIGEISDSITFYGTQTLDFFPAFYAKMDMIVSPNIPFTLAPGAFDGFPLSTCVEAALCETAVFCTDELKQNQDVFREGEEIVILSPEPEQIFQTIKTYLARPERLAQIGVQGRQAFLRVYDFDRQMQPRLRVVADIAPRRA